MRIFQLILLAGTGLIAGCSSLPAGPGDVAPLVKADPLTPEAHLTRGCAFSARGEGGLAAREFETALRQDPRFVPALATLGNLAFDRRDWKTARSFYTRALVL